MSDVLHSGMHPDADVLNAFMEGVLPDHERVACLAHLAECAHCREVVSLVGQAAADPVEAALAPGKPPFWRRFFQPFPVFTAAAVAIVLSFSVGIYRMIKSAEPKPVVTASASPAVETPSAEPEPLSAPQRAQTKTPPRAVVVKRERPADADAAAPPPASVPAPPQPQPAAIVPQPAAPTMAFAPRPATPERPPATAVVGTVTDPTGAVVPNAQVELKNDASGATFPSTANARGEFSIAGLTPGKYDLSISAPGFKKYEKPLVDVPPQEIARLDSRLEVGAANEAVTVSSESPVLKSESGQAARPALAPLAGIVANARSRRPNEIVPAYTLPDKSKPLSFAVQGKIVLANDSAGALFFSDNEGKSWKRVKGKWNGKVVRVMSPPVTPGQAAAVFELITEPVSTWLSADGRKWFELSAPGTAGQR